MTHAAINWLHEVLRLGRRILEMAESLDFEEYRSAEYPRIGIERYLISMGEAARADLKDDSTLKQSVPDLGSAIDLRNFLTHAYLHIDNLVVWNVVKEELPRLLEDVERIIRDEGRLLSDF